MSLLASEKIVIDRSPQDIFDYVSNMENFSDWFIGVEHIASLNELSHGTKGKTYLETVKIPFKGKTKVKITVVESQSPTTFITEGSLSPIKPRMEITIREISERSEVTWAMYSRNRSFLFEILMFPLVKFEMSKRAKRSVKRLKENFGG